MSKELTNAWINKKMEAGSIYFVKVKDGYGYKIEPMVVDMEGDLSDLEGKRYMPYASQNDILEIISLCDYEILSHLETKAEWQAERIKELQQDVKTLTNNYKLLEDKQASDIIHGQALVDEFGDFEALYEELVRLRKEVAKGDEIIGKLLNEGHAAIEKNKQLSRLLKGRLEKALNNN